MVKNQRKSAGESEKFKTVVSNDSKGALKCIGGSRSDQWNNILANQTIQTLWLQNSDEDTRDRQFGALVAGLVGIGPKDELEGMIAAQLLAAHNAAMECYRRATLGGQTFEGRRESLSQANKLSRTFAVLLDALNRHRGNGQQRVIVEYLHVHPGGQAVVGVVEAPGGGDRLNPEGQPYAKQIAHAPEPAMQSAQPEERSTVSVASNAERALPDARRKVAGRP
jgi:hypothetical protein